jgi:hypothetical protein
MKCSRKNFDRMTRIYGFDYKYLTISRLCIFHLGSFRRIGFLKVYDPADISIVTGGGTCSPWRLRWRRSS